VETPKPFKAGDKPWPYVPLALIEQLALVYPDRSPKPTDTNRKIWMDAGAAEVVRKLRHVHSIQTKQDIQSS
jgi:hypothetical protein